MTRAPVSFAIARAIVTGSLLSAILLAGCSGGPEQRDAFSPGSPPQPPSWGPPRAVYLGVEVTFDSLVGDTVPMDAGMATVQLADSANAPLRSFTIAYEFLTGWIGSIQVAPGSYYTLTYHPPAGYHVVGGDDPQKIWADSDFLDQIEIAP